MDSYCYRYPRPSVTTDCVIFGFDGIKLQVLLILRGNEPYQGCWAFPGGFLNMDETAEEGALRELEEETGLRDIFIDQLQVFSAVDRDPRGRTLTIAYYALVDPVDIVARGQDDAVAARWFAIDALPVLAFDHAQIFEVACKRLALKVYLQLKGLEEKENHFQGFDLERLWTAIPGAYQLHLK